MKNINSSRKRELRRTLHSQYRGFCAYCGKPTSLSAGTVDHYIPWSLGGGNGQDNLRWSCSPCNQWKGDMPPEEWEKVKPPYAPPAAVDKYAQKTALLARIAPRAKPTSFARTVSAQTADAGEQIQQPVLLE